MFFKQENALVDAIDEDDIETIEDLILSEYHLENEPDICSNYLVYAIEYGHTDAALYLVEAKVGLTATNHGCDNPLIKAAELGNNQVLAAILDKNIIPLHYQDLNQKTALDYAKEQNNQEAVRLLSVHPCARHQMTVQTACLRDSYCRS